jgi:RimJ/RimL family protein N-acetyltransferase
MRTLASSRSTKSGRRSLTGGRDTVVSGGSSSRAVILADGSELALRPIGEQDLDSLISFHEHLSPESVHNRFFGIHPHLSVSESRAFVTVDGHQRMAFVLLDRGLLVAVGRYEGLDDRERAEVAFVVADAFQRHGLAPVLLRVLAEYARGQGYRRFVAQLLSSNAAMREVFASSGLSPVFTRHQGVTDVELDLRAVEVASGPDPLICTKEEALRP